MLVNLFPCLFTFLYQSGHPPQLPALMFHFSRINMNHHLSGIRQIEPEAQKQDSFSQTVYFSLFLIQLHVLLCKFSFDRLQASLQFLSFVVYHN